MYHVIIQLFFMTRLGKKLKNKLAQRLGDVKTEDQVNLITQDKKNDEPVTYSEVDHQQEEESHLSHTLIAQKAGEIMRATKIK